MSLISGGWTDDEFRQRFSTAARFYLRAIQSSDSDLEIAYRHLITVGDVLSSHFDYGAELLEEQVKAGLSVIADIPDGVHVVRRVRSILRRRLLPSLKLFKGYSTRGRYFFVSLFRYYARHMRGTADKAEKIMCALFITTEAPTHPNLFTKILEAYSALVKIQPQASLPIRL